MKNHSILTLLVAATIIDTVIGYYLLITKSGGKFIREWYKLFNISAYAMDILSIVIGCYIATLFTTDLYKQIPIVILVGLIHDLSFSYFVRNSGIKTKIFEICDNYAKELGFTILIVDAFLLMSTIILSSFLNNNLSYNNISFLGIFTFYLGLFMIYSF